MTESIGIHTTLVRAAEWCEGRLEGESRVFHGVTTDSRRVAPGNLFIALRGPNHDGHDHLRAAIEKGAVAALVETPVALPGEIEVPQLRVSSTRAALGRLAAGWRRELATPLVAITGSNGKTTVKEMTAAILSRKGAVLATHGNLNNDIGVPLTLLRLTPEHRFAVVEMGANHAGEIAYLTRLARPDASLITNAAAAHLAGFGSLQGVARAKGEIFSGLDESGTAVINADDDFAGLWVELAGERRVLRFGLDREAELTASWNTEADGSRLMLQLPDGEVECRLALLGRHNVANALAAAALAISMGLSGDDIAAGLGSLQPVKGRLVPRAALNGARLIDDSYNANPDSLRAGIEVLATASGRRVLALGDMGELGDDAPALHARAGEDARRKHIDALYATGPLARFAAEAFGPQGRHFDTIDALVAALRSELSPEVTVLVKGSRTARMERVADALAGGDA
ncbi:UDP-N-acetylmuramoyl-tripeptide--D-alanyl-D-alanine ligase [Thiohalomonas denitrificans]|uniref:UDP-N-acetylmuramoyl-tripeptide--D-alanyl-D-alanine ligase n=1 Tax=Thiohalomonas denitrificans TaxID=415747 RepID=A0A1G5PN04_9GAMM|nr:UDP-N-acetylmuramoyl-tripeptide--D-alanyl-D-alanine ligase [Thiohalomonas denitrificans]SCZ50449.1 UDP-N-acetylmuramoyl-tripeptide--D-alanyl-D-alanine ligase [Thiohalomonas denitrificans]